MSTLERDLEGTGEEARHPEELRAELHQAHAILEGIALGTDDLIAAQDLAFRYTFFNGAYRREFARMWGHRLRVGDDMVALLEPWPAERDKARALWARALDGESFRITMEFGPTPEVRRTYDLRFNPIRDAAGVVVGAAHIFRDVTDQVQAQDALRAARAEAEEASQAKSRFLATMSHELRTPLAGIIGYADLLESGVLGETNPKQRETLSRIKAGCWHLVGIIDEVLTLSRAEAGKEEVQLTRTDAAAVVREVAALVEPQAVAAGLALEVDGAGEPLEVRTDAGKLRQILVNLVGNAVKYTAEGRVRVGLERPGAGGGDGASFAVHVADTGDGIAPEHHDRIFEAFTRVEDSQAAARSGTGLGLAIARRLARLLGGDVTLESAPGQGSTFTLRLPLSAPPVQTP